MYHNNYIFIKTTRETKTPRNAEESFYYFLQNSKLRFVSYNSNTFFMFNCIFNKDDNLSPYFYLDVNGQMENVKIISIKISFICENKEHAISFRSKYKNSDAQCTQEIMTHYINPYDFFKENCIQSEISEAGIINLNRNSPILLFSKLYDNKSKNYKMLFKTFIRNINKENRVYIKELFGSFNNVDNNLLKSKYYFAISGIEYIRREYVNSYDLISCIIDDINYNINHCLYNESIDHLRYDEESLEIFNLTNVNPFYSLELVKNSERLKMIYNIARLEIINIALNTSYSHGGYHIENMFLYEELQSIIMTDFSKVKHIPKIKNIQNNWYYLEENNFSLEKDSFKIMKEILGDIYDTHFQDTDINSRQYKWLKIIDEKDVIIIEHLYKIRKITNGGIKTHIFEMYLNTRRSEYVYCNSLEIDTATSNVFLDYISKLFC